MVPLRVYVPEMNTVEMKRTPSALKWLAEQRARKAGEMLVHDQICKRLEYDVNELRTELAEAELKLRAADQKKDVVRAELNALDKVVGIFDVEINPEAIQPVNGWAGRYGKRGALNQFLLETMQAAYPKALSTKELEFRAIEHFMLSFEDREQHRHWYAGTFRGTLKRLCANGAIEQGPPETYLRGQVATWQWIPSKRKPKSIAELRKK